MVRQGSRGHGSCKSKVGADETPANSNCRKATSTEKSSDAAPGSAGHRRVVVVELALPSDHGGDRAATAASDLTDLKLGLAERDMELAATKSRSIWINRRSEPRRCSGHHGGGSNGGGGRRERVEHRGGGDGESRERVREWRLRGEREEWRSVAPTDDHGRV